MKIVSRIKRLLELQIALRKIDRAGVWFIDIPRTGSTSIKVQLGEKLDYIFGKADDKYSRRPSPFPDHSIAQEMRALFGVDRWNRIFTFSFVRNPWDRMLSIYLFRRNIIKTIPPSISFKDYIMMLSYPQYNFSAYYSPYSYRGYYYSACEYILGRRAEPIVSFVGKYENRHSALETISKTIGLQLSEDLSLSVSRGESHYSEYYDSTSMEIVAQFFKDDIKAFGYEF